MLKKDGDYFDFDLLFRAKSREWRDEVKGHTQDKKSERSEVLDVSHKYTQTPPFTLEGNTTPFSLSFAQHVCGSIRVRWEQNEHTNRIEQGPSTVSLNPQLPYWDLQTTPWTTVQELILSGQRVK